MNSIITTDAWSYKLFEQYLNTFFRELKVNLEKHIIPALIYACSLLASRRLF